MGKLQSTTAAILPLCGTETVPSAEQGYRLTRWVSLLLDFLLVNTRRVSASGITPSVGLLLLPRAGLWQLTPAV